MPHASVKTIRQLIYWEYAKLISGSTLGDRKSWGFVMHSYQKLNNGKIHPSNILRDNKRFFEDGQKCVYCGKTEYLEWDHIIPQVKLSLDTIDNQVLACKHCNCCKGGRDPFEWYGKERMYEIPRVVLGKYLKLIYDIHEKQGTLDSCDLNGDGKIDIFDLGVVFKNTI